MLDIRYCAIREGVVGSGGRGKVLLRVKSLIMG